MKTYKTSIQILKIAYKLNKRYFFITLFSIILTSITPVVITYFFARLLNSLESNTLSSSELLTIVIGYTATIYLGDVADRLYYAINPVLYGYDISRYFTHEVIKKCTDLDIEVFENPKYADFRSKALDAYEWRPTDFFRILTTVIKALGTAVSSAIAVFFINPTASLFIILSLLPSIITEFKMQKGLWSMWSADARTRRKYGYLLFVNDSKEPLKDIKLLNLAGYFRKTLMNLIDKVYNNQKKIEYKRAYWTIATSILPIAVIGYYIYTISNQVILKQIEIGTLSFFVANIFSFQNRFATLVFNLNQLISNSRYMEVIFDFLRIPKKIITKPNAIKKIFPPFEIEFEDIDFKYPDTEGFVLKDFSLKIKPNEKIAIVGVNGAGKTSFVKLLLRFYDVTNGKILINGMDLRDLDVNSWWDNISVLLQDFYTFSLPSVKENIGFGNIAKFEKEMEINTDYVPESIVNAARLAKADSFIDKYETSYNTILGRDFEGIELSGGENQRLALARTFYRDSPIVILDEPTSNIDAQAEAEIFETLEQHLENKTVIFISHRFSTVRKADRIVVIDSGKIIENGTHDELIDLNGVYNKMFSLQAKGYK